MAAYRQNSHIGHHTFDFGKKKPSMHLCMRLLGENKEKQKQGFAWQREGEKKVLVLIDKELI